MRASTQGENLEKAAAVFPSGLNFYRNQPLAEENHQKCVSSPSSAERGHPLSLEVLRANVHFSSAECKPLHIRPGCSKPHSVHLPLVKI